MVSFKLQLAELVLVKKVILQQTQQQRLPLLEHLQIPVKLMLD
jgi:hypothetical protein